MNEDNYGKYLQMVNDLLDKVNSGELSEDEILLEMKKAEIKMSVMDAKPVVPSSFPVSLN